MESRCQYAVADPSMTAEEVGDLMYCMLGDQDLQEASERSELKREACRFTGCAATFKRFGVIEDDGPLPRTRQRADLSSSKDALSSDDQEKNQDSGTLRLGSTQRRCKKTDDSTKLHEFLTSCRANGDAWKIALQQTSFQHSAQRIDVILKNISKPSKVWPVDASGYLRKFIAHKLLLVCVWEGQLRETAWSTVTVGDLLPIMPCQP